jgi:hypothetical protein
MQHLLNTYKILKKTIKTRVKRSIMFIYQMKVRKLERQYKQRRNTVKGRQS